MNLSIVAVVVLAILWPTPLAAQELEPRAYSVSPVGVNVVVLANSFNGGDVSFDPTLPVSDASARVNTTAISYVRTLELFGRSVNVGAALPFTVGRVEGIYIGEFTRVERAGLLDPRLRFSINLYGAPAMSLQEFAARRQRTTIGFSLSAALPLGEYDPSKLINLGANRWSFKPEIGISHLMGRWTVELYAGAWLFTDNNDFFGGKKRQQAPIGSAQVHLIYTLRPRAWLAVNANFYTGGRTTVDGRINLDLQKNSRVGATLSLPVGQRQSLKIAYSRGAYTTIGADFHAVAVGFQHIWGAGL